MNIFQRFAAKAFSLDINGEKRVEWLTKLYNATFPNRGSMFTGRSAKQLTALQVSTRGLVFTCIDKWAKAEAAAPIYVKLRLNQKDSQLAPLSHRAIALIENPNPIYSDLEVRDMVTKWLMINGNVFLFTPDFDLPFPMQMWVLDPTKMRIIIGKGDDLIEGYEYQGQGGLMYFPEKYICHIRTLQPSANQQKQLLGTGIVEAVLEDASIDVEGREFLKNYFVNDARPPQILSSPNKDFESQEAWELYKTNWNRKNPNNKLHGYLSGGQKIEQLDGSSLDMDFVEVNKLTRQGMTEVFGVPLTMIEGTFNGRATAQVITNYFLTGTINPFLKILDSALTKHFRQWDVNVIIEHEYYVDNDTEEIRAQESHLLSTGQITINELLKKANKPGIGVIGDTRFVPNNLVPLEKAIAPTPPPGFGGKSASGVKLDLNFPAVVKKSTSEPDEREILWRTFDSLTGKKADTLQGEISKVFADLEREILSNVTKNQTAYLALHADLFDNPETQASDFEAVKLHSYNTIIKSELIQVAELFNDEEWMRKLESATGETLTALQKAALLESLKAIGENMDSLPSGFSDVLENELKNSTAKITESIGTIRDEVRGILAKNTDATAAELKELLTAKFETLKVSRAETIARTSANHTTNAAQSKTWDNYGIDIVWLSQRDGGVRDSHLAADGQKRGEDGMFQVGGDTMPYPCAGSIAEENVNCRCMQFPEKRKKE